MFAISLECLEEGGWYKYIRLKTGEIRFTKIDGQHSDLVSPKEKNLVVSAGAIKIRDEVFTFEGYGSHTLGVGFTHEDEEHLSRLLGKKPIASWDW